MTRFIGIDLAWSARNLSGIAVLDQDDDTSGVRLISSTLEHSDADICQIVSKWAGPSHCLLGIDAPLIAPNKAGTSRPCDGQVTSDFGRYHAGTYPANRERCARPIRLRQALERGGFSADPDLKKGPDPCRRQLEIFPHPAHVVLFHRKRIIKYKKGSVEKKRTGLTEMIDNLRRYLHTEDPPLVQSAVLASLLDTDIAALRGRAMKGFEDKVDALLCAYMAAYYWQWRERRCRVYGNVETGYIICPRLSGN